jgi:RNA polymerase sigma-70 factor, ECF subfamily
MRWILETIPAALQKEGRKAGRHTSKLISFDMLVDANEREVIEGCQRGDQDAFTALFEANQDKVYSIALRFSGNEAVAMDIAQETFLKLLSHIQHFRAEANFETWLYRIVINTCLDHRRRGRKWMPLVEGLLDLCRASRETVLHDLLRAEMQQHVQHGVGRLSPELRVVVILRYTEGLAYEQIAEIMGCSPGTVASRLNRAHKALERKLSHLRKARGGSGG